MAADNHTTIVGNLVDDPEVRFTNNGIAVANLRVAVTQRIQQDGEWRDGDTSFLKVNVWRGQAEHLADSLTKGDRVMITGRLRQRSWETPEGDKRSVTEIEADEVGASLKWATAKVERTSQRGNGDRTQGRERQAATARSLPSCASGRTWSPPKWTAPKRFLIRRLSVGVVPGERDPQIRSLDAGRCGRPGHADHSPARSGAELTSRSMTSTPCSPK
jgi:single-strand DNA-binding protein